LIFRQITSAGFWKVSFIFRYISSHH